jgi:hypothetical protein
MELTSCVLTSTTLFAGDLASSRKGKESKEGLKGKTDGKKALEKLDKGICVEALGKPGTPIQDKKVDEKALEKPRDKDDNEEDKGASRNAFPDVYRVDDGKLSGVHYNLFILFI